MTPKALSISGITSSDKVYDGNASATMNTGSTQYAGLINGDVVNVAATGLFNNKNVGTGKTVTITSSYSGADKDNYTITDQATTSANVTPKALTISAVTAANKMFDGNNNAVVNGVNAVFNGLINGEKIQIVSAGKFSDSNPAQGKAVSYEVSGSDLANYTVTKAVVSADITPQPSAAVSALTAPQTGITGTADNNAATSSATSTTVAPGSGTTSLASVATQVLIVAPPAVKPVVIPNQGAMNLASSGRSSEVRLIETGNVTTLTFGNAAAGLDKPTVTTPALPVFNVSASKPVAESAVVVNANNSAISVTGAGAAETGLTANAAQSSATKAAGQMKTATATLTMPDGTSANMTVGVTAEGVLVVAVPAQSADADNNKAVSLLAMATAKDALGVAPDALKGVLIQAADKP